MKTLGLLFFLAAAWCVLMLLIQHLRTGAYGKRVLFAAPGGRPADGVRYAFLQGMSPKAKESVREHVPSYVAGILYHLGAFGSLAWGGLHAGGGTLPALARIPMGALLAAGVAGGLVLLVKRLRSSELRQLSNPDDYVSNLLVTCFIALGALVLGMPHLQALWLAWGVVLLVYIPMGKIRHCLFFFSTRRAFGAFFGRRGVFPPGGSHVR